MKFILLKILGFYQALKPLRKAIGSTLGFSDYSCRFTPTCSRYAYESIEKHGAGLGSLLAVKRFLKCHPFSKSPHFDPVK